MTTWIVRTARRLAPRRALAAAGRPGRSWGVVPSHRAPDDVQVPHEERLVGLAVVAFLVLTLFA